MHESFQVGDFVVEPMLNRIRCDDKTVQLESKAVEVLVYLAKHPKEVLPKERIIGAVWPETFVSDDVLTHAISELRKAFRDDARNPRVIQTVPRKGYRLIAPVFREKLEPKSPAQPPGGIAQRGYLIGGLLFVLAAAAAVYWLSPHPAVDKPGWSQLQPIRLTSYPGMEREPSFSPDGNRVAFSWEGEKGENTDIYVKGIGPGAALRLTEHPAVDFGPAWSPDDHYIAFLRRLSRLRASVLLVPPLGGPERTLAETWFPHRRPDQFHPPYLAWSPDGEWLVVSDKETRTEPFGLFLLSRQTGEKRRLTRPPADSVGDSSPAFSPDGRTLVFSRVLTREVGHLYLLPLSARLEPNGVPRRLTSGSGLSTSPAWDSDETIVFAAGAGRYALWRMEPFNPAEPKRLGVPQDHCEGPAVSRRTRRLVFSSHVEDIDIWRAELAGLRGPAGKPVRLISSTQPEYLPDYSPDGKKIAFVSKRTGSEEIWVCDSDGSNPLQLTSFGGPRTGTPHWSPDGERIAFDSRAGERANVYVIERDGGPPRRLTTGLKGGLVPTWSRDGKWIYFHSSPGIYKAPSEGGEAVQVTGYDGYAVSESDDGEFLYYYAITSAGDLWKLSLQPGSQPARVLEKVAYDSFVVVDQGVYFVPALVREGNVAYLDVSSGPVGSVMFLDFATGQIELKLRMEGPPSIGLSVSPGGRSILYSQKGHTGADLMLVENFR